MLLFRDQIQDSYTGSRSCQTLNPISQTRSRLVLSPQTVFSMFFSRSSERRTKLLALERGTALLLSKDGSTILDEGPRTALRYSPFHDLLGGRRTEDVFSGSSFSYQTLDPEPQTRALTSEGGRRTVDVFSGSSDQELGREASERGTDLLAPEQPLFFF